MTSRHRREGTSGKSWAYQHAVHLLAHRVRGARNRVGGSFPSKGTLCQSMGLYRLPKKRLTGTMVAICGWPAKTQLPMPASFHGERLADAERLRAAIDSGQTGDKVAWPDPSVAPMGTDDEAGNTGAPRLAEVPQPAAGQPPPRGLGAAWIQIALVCALSAAALAWAARVFI